VTLWNLGSPRLLTEQTTKTLQMWSDPLAHEHKYHSLKRIGKHSTGPLILTPSIFIPIRLFWRRQVYIYIYVIHPKSTIIIIIIHILYIYHTHMNVRSVLVISPQSRQWLDRILLVFLFLTLKEKNNYHIILSAGFLDMSIRIGVKTYPPPSWLHDLIILFI